MQEQDDGLTPAAREVEAALRKLSPAQTTIDPISAAFAAGRQSNRSQLHLWRAAAAILLLIGGTSWMLPSTHRDISAPAEQRTIIVERAPARSFPPAPSQSLLILQDTARLRGIEALPAAHLPAVRASRTHEGL